MRRALAVVLTLVGASGVGCGSSSNAPEASPVPDARDATDESDATDAPLSLEAFPAEFASRYCRRVYDCCVPADRSVASPGDDEATCTAEMTKNARNNAQFLLSFEGVAYFERAARHCLDLLDTGSCTEVFDQRTATLLACQDVFAGVLPLDALCEDARQCASGTCAVTTCAVAVTCAGTDVVNDSNGCVPRVGVGEPCLVSRQCPPDASCVGGACKQHGTLGATCARSDDCVDACGVTPTGVGVCRAGYCLGR